MLLQELQKRWQLLKNPDYRNFCISGLLATFGAGFSFITLSFYGYRDNDGLTGIISLFIAWWLPSVVLAPIVGSLVDRYNGKHLIIISSIVRGVVLLALFASFKIGWHVNILAVAVIQGVFNALYMPSAIPLVYRLVEEDELLRANATVDVVYELGFILGLGLSGVMLLYVAIDNLLVVAGVLMVLSGMMIFRLKTKNTQPPKTEKTAWYQDFAQSLSYLKHHPLLLLPYSTQVVIKMLMMSISTLLLPYVHEVLHRDTKTFSKYEIVYSVGAIAGGLISPILSEKVGDRWALRILLIIMGIGLLLMSMNRDWLIGLPIYFLVGVGLASWAVAVTEAQKVCPVEYQGRMQATFDGINGIFVMAVYIGMMVYKEQLAIPSLYLMFSGFVAVGILINFISPKKIAKI